MRNTKRDKSYDISFRGRLVSSHPFLGERILRRLSSLRDVFTGGVELSFDVGSDKQIFRSEGGSSCDDRVGLREEGREIFAHDLRDRTTLKSVSRSPDRSSERIKRTLNPTGSLEE